LVRFVLFWILSWCHLPCICNSLKLEPVILHGICYILPWSPSILHGISQFLELQPLICMIFATCWYFKRSCHVGFFRASLWFRLGFLLGFIF
jgi:hypothetical protein